MKKDLLLSAVALAAGPLFAALVPVSPQGGETIPVVPEVQLSVQRLATHAERVALLKADAAGEKKLAKGDGWKKARPLVLSWEATGRERGPWKLELGKDPALLDARVHYVSNRKVNVLTGRAEGDGAAAKRLSCEFPLANLEVGETYYWRVTCNGRCGKWACGPKCGCNAFTNVVRSAVASFKTDPAAPRWIAIEGNVKNIRDLGGWPTADGGRIRQGLVYRGQGLNDNSVTGEGRGRNRLTVEDVRYLTGTLGIRTDLDLRSIGETADLAESPLGPQVKFILRSSESYQGIFTPNGMKVMAENFRVFCDRANYPVYFHCIGGADRTGALAYVLKAVCDVSLHDLEVDWEQTFYPRLSELWEEYDGPGFWCQLLHFDQGFAAYGDAQTPIREKVVAYLHACGVTDEEIGKVRAILIGR